MRILGIEIVTTKTIDDRIRAAADGLATRKASEIVKRYAHNESCLRAAVTARLRTREDNAFIPPFLLENETRMITAFADRMAEVRTGARP